MDASSQPKPILVHVETQQKFMCQFLIIFLLASGSLVWLVWGFFHFQDLIPCLVQESTTCVRSTLPQDEAVVSGTERKYKVLYLGVSDHLFSHRYIYQCYTRNIRVVQLAKKPKQSQDFYYRLPAGRPKSKIKLSQQDFLFFFSKDQTRHQGIFLTFFSQQRPNLGTILGQSWVFSVRQGQDHHTSKCPPSSTSCLQHSVLHKSGNEPVHFGSITRRLGQHSVKLE